MDLRVNIGVSYLHLDVVVINSPIQFSFNAHGIWYTYIQPEKGTHAYFCIICSEDIQCESLSFWRKIQIVPYVVARIYYKLTDVTHIYDTKKKESKQLLSLVSPHPYIMLIIFILFGVTSK